MGLLCVDLALEDPEVRAKIAGEFREAAELLERRSAANISTTFSCRQNSLSVPRRLRTAGKADAQDGSIELGIGVVRVIRLTWRTF